jgi:predicted nucleic acid-binding protein
MKGIADAGFLVAALNRHDQFHGWASALAHDIHEPLLTCEAVLAETAFHLHDAELVLSLVREGMVKPVFSLANNRQRLEVLAARFRDLKPDLADLCLICMSEDHPGLPVITTDKSNFQVYRRFKRQIIPTITP